ncbi:MAG: phytanoyl-CoA dioxygenase family protein [Acidimicrobiales bacterium]
MLTTEQLTGWNRDGFLVLPDLYSASEISALRTRMAEMIDDFDPTTVSTVFSTTEGTHAQDQYFLSSGGATRFFFEAGALDQNGVLQVPKTEALNKVGHAMHDLDPVFSTFSRAPQIAELVADLGMAEALVLQSMYIFKQPRIGGEVNWHCDHSFLWTEPQSVVGLWIALEDATLENGCLWAVPGGHVLPAKNRFRRDGDGTRMEVLDESPYDTSQAVPLEVKAGTVIVLHGTLPHASAPNTSDKSRHAYTLHILDSSADYPADNWLQRPAEMPLRSF